MMFTKGAASASGGSTAPRVRLVSRLGAASASAALLLSVLGAGAGPGLSSGIAAASQRHAKTPKIVTGGTASYSLLPGDVFTWIIPIESQQAYEPYQTNIEDETYLPLFWFGNGSNTGINYKLSIANPPIWSNGDKTVTIHMKNTFKWSTGTPVTSSDVKFFFEMLEAGKTQIGNYLPGLMPDNLASVTYPDSYTVVLHLKKAYNPLWFNGNQLGWIYPLPVQAWDKTSPPAHGSIANSSSPAGAKSVFSFMFTQAKDRSTYSTNPMWKVVDGPFVISSYDPVTHAATFARNSNYSGATKPHLASYSVYSFTTGTAELNALRSGKITFGYVPFSELSQVSYFKSRGYTVKSWPIFYDEVVEFSYTSKTWAPLARQLYIRQALQHLITQNLFIKQTLGGYGLQDYGPVALFPKSSYVAPAIKRDPYPYDPSAAAHLLASHGWAKGSGGYLVCKRPGTGSSECGKGIPKGRKLTFLYMYSTGTTAFFAQVSAFRTAAKKVGIDLRLDGQTVTTMYSIAGVCPTSPCKWGMAGYAGWFWNYGQYELLPVGEDEFGKGNYWGGGYFTAKAQKLITEAETKPGTKSLYADETYLSKQVPSLWWPLSDWEVATVKKTLSGWQHLNPYANYMPQTWYLTKS
jgi:peptide/nickel transport system substrate-binding protein